MPIGLWTASLALDPVGASRSAGFLTAAGLADWTSTDGKERRLGLLHGLLNGVGLTLQLRSLGWRLRGRRFRAMRYAWLGWSVSMLAAYLGGELVYDRGVMVNRHAWTTGPGRWRQLGPLAAVPDGGIKPAELDGRTLVIYRDGDRVYALEGACAHAGGPLSEGEVAEGVVTCPWHGSRFRLTDGAAVRGPTTFPQPRLEVRVRAGRIEVRGSE